MSVISATPEVEIERIMAQGKKLVRLQLNKTFQIWWYTPVISAILEA
jgi:hypothetical protein